jgi:hypothetical protein
MKVIPLSGGGGGREAIVDDEDYDLVRQYFWGALKKTARSGYYACHAPGPRRGPNAPKHNLMMHRLIMGVDDPRIEVDHRNGDGLDNRRANLRTCTHAQNTANQRKSQRPLTSRYKGVCRADGKWLAQIGCAGRNYRIGSFAVEEDAARAYDAKAVELFGEFARVNFDG